MGEALSVRIRFSLRNWKLELMLTYPSQPIKTFHTNPRVGRSLMSMIEDLLESKELVLPEITLIEGGLAAVNVSKHLSCYCRNSS